MGNVAYYAGLVDGEGHVGLLRVKNKDYKREGYQLRVAISMNEPEVLEELKEEYGGTLIRRQPKGKRAHYMWSITANGAMEFLEAIRPYSRIKAEQIKICVDFQKTRAARTANRKTDKEWKRENEQYTKLRRLNARFGTEYYSSS